MPAAIMLNGRVAVVLVLVAQAACAGARTIVVDSDDSLAAALDDQGVFEIVLTPGYLYKVLPAEVAQPQGWLPREVCRNLTVSTPVEYGAAITFGGRAGLLELCRNVVLSLVNITATGVPQLEDSPAFSQHIQYNNFALNLWPSVQASGPASFYFNNTILYYPLETCSEERMERWWEYLRGNFGNESVVEEPQGMQLLGSHAITVPVSKFDPLQLKNLTGAPPNPATTNPAGTNYSITGTDVHFHCVPDPFVVDAFKNDSDILELINLDAGQDLPQGGGLALAAPGELHSSSPPPPSSSSSSSALPHSSSSPSEAAPSSDPDGGSGAPPSWVWAAIFVPTGLLLLLLLLLGGAAGLLLRRRPRRERPVGQQRGGQRAAADSGKAMPAAAAKGGGGGVPGGAGGEDMSPADFAGSMGAFGDGEGVGGAGIPPAVGVKSVGLWNPPLAAGHALELWGEAPEGLRIGRCIGVGGYAKVYQGTWNGSKVAVKVMHGPSPASGSGTDASAREADPGSASTSTGRTTCPTASAEGGAGGASSSAASVTRQEDAVLCSLVSTHPNVVAIYRMWGWRAPGERQQEAAGGRLKQGEVVPAAVPRQGERFMLMELCDMGTLHDAVAGGRLYSDPHSRAQLALCHLLRCLLDVANAMQHLHSQDPPVVHGDLKPSNVLLKCTQSDPRGYTCKVADFGLSRYLLGGGGADALYTQNIGTASYMAPEVLDKGRLSTSADVYSWAALAWEAVSGEALHPRMSFGQVYYSTVVEMHRPELPACCPGRLARLIRRSWDTDPGLRPGFGEVQRELVSMLVEIAEAEAGAVPAEAGAVR